jgi:outer membrane lipase/esterase
MKRLKLWASALGAALVLAACGGGDTASFFPKAYVAGDSLNDVGVFGARFTVQSGNPASPYLVWPEHVANAYQLDSLCPAYNALLASVAHCTGYAVGGAQINPVSVIRTGGWVTGASIGSDSSPMSIVKQIQDMGAGRRFASNDLIMIDGGGNDVNALASTLLEGLGGNTAGIPAYKTILSDLLPTASVTAVLDTDTNGLINLGGAYMQKTAKMLADAIKTNLIAKGAGRVVILNLPDLSKAPVLNSAGASAGAIVNAWAQAMNAQLASELASESAKVLIFDFYSALNGFVDNPGSAGVGLVTLSNVRDKACGTTGITSCIDTTLDASGPSDWRTYLFADDLHATPFGNELTAQAVRAAISTKGWTYSK